MSKDIMDRARDRMKRMIKNETREIPVPHLDESEKDAVIFYIYPITTQEYQNIVRYDNESDKCVQTLIERVRDADGTKRFNNVEFKEIKRNFDLGMLLDLTREINKDLQDIMAENAEETVGK